MRHICTQLLNLDAELQKQGRFLQRAFLTRMHTFPLTHSRPQDWARLSFLDYLCSSPPLVRVAWCSTRSFMT